MRLFSSVRRDAGAEVASGWERCAEGEKVAGGWVLRGEAAAVML